MAGFLERWDSGPAYELTIFFGVCPFDLRAQDSKVDMRGSFGEVDQASLQARHAHMARPRLDNAEPYIHHIEDQHSLRRKHRSQRLKARKKGTSEMKKNVRYKFVVFSRLLIPFPNPICLFPSFSSYRLKILA
jgi:hypothetical protein